MPLPAGGPTTSCSMISISGNNNNCGAADASDSSAGAGQGTPRDMRHGGGAAVAVPLHHQGEVAAPALPAAFHVKEKWPALADSPLGDENLGASSDVIAATFAAFLNCVGTASRGAAIPRGGFFSHDSVRPGGTTTTTSHETSSVAAQGQVSQMCEAQHLNPIVLAGAEEIKKHLYEQGPVLSVIAPTPGLIAAQSAHNSRGLSPFEGRAGRETPVILEGWEETHFGSVWLARCVVASAASSAGADCGPSSTRSSSFVELPSIKLAMGQNGVDAAGVGLSQGELEGVDWSGGGRRAGVVCDVQLSPEDQEKFRSWLVPLPRAEHDEVMLGEEQAHSDLSLSATFHPEDKFKYNIARSNSKNLCVLRLNAEGLEAVGKAVYDVGLGTSEVNDFGGLIGGCSWPQEGMVSGVKRTLRIAHDLLRSAWPNYSTIFLPFHLFRFVLSKSNGALGAGGAKALRGNRSGANLYETLYDSGTKICGVIGGAMGSNKRPFELRVAGKIGISRRVVVEEITWSGIAGQWDVVFGVGKAQGSEEQVQAGEDENGRDVEGDGGEQ